MLSAGVKLLIQLVEQGEDALGLDAEDFAGDVHVARLRSMGDAMDIQEAANERFNGGWGRRWGPPHRARAGSSCTSKNSGRPLQHDRRLGQWLDGRIPAAEAPGAARADAQWWR